MNPYVADFTVAFLNTLMWAVIFRILLSWFPIDQSSMVYQLLWRVTEPLIDPFRRVMPSAGMFDLSPMATIIALVVLSQIVIELRLPEY